MKIDEEDMPPVHAAPREAVYKKEEVTVTKGDMLSSDPHQRASDYARKHGFIIATCISEALDLRRQGKKFMTLREADTCARKSYQLDSQLLLAALMEGPAHIIDDDVAKRFSVFKFRAAYNQNIAVIKGKLSPPEEVAKAKKINKKILFALDKVKLGAWPEEEENGFHPDLCKPDFMNWDQYNQRMNREPAESLYNWEEIFEEYEKLYATN